MVEIPGVQNAQEIEQGLFLDSINQPHQYPKSE